MKLQKKLTNDFFLMSKVVVWVLGAIFFGQISNIANGANHHVSVAGSSSGTGTVASPWDLTTAMNHPTKVVAGDTIFLHKGTYIGNYTCLLTGTEVKPIVVCPFIDDRGSVIIDGNTGKFGMPAVLNLKSPNVIVRDLKIINSFQNRISAGTSTPTEFPSIPGVTLNAANVKLINCIVRDHSGNGISSTDRAVNSEIYGCIISNNGYKGSDRAHGHSLYIQNLTGTKSISDNVIFGGYAYGVHAYTEGGNLVGFNYQGNIIFNSGNLAGSSPNMLVGGYKPVDALTIEKNYLYQSPTSSALNLQLGYDAVNKSGTVNGNVIYGGSGNTIRVTNWDKVVFTNNKLVNKGTARIIDFNPSSIGVSSYSWDKNEYYNGTFDGNTFSKWKSDYGFDASSTHTTSLPTTNHIAVRANKYEVGRGNVVVFNWEMKTSVSVDLSSLRMAIGTEFLVYDAQNLDGNPVFKGIWSGTPVILPMNLTAITKPGGNAPVPSHTSIEFGTFLVVSSNPTTRIPTGITDSPVETASLKLVSAYPNPAVEQVAVEFLANDEEPVTVDVLSSNGQVVHSEVFQAVAGSNKLEVNLAKFSLGFYFVRVRNSKGHFVCKVIKRHV